MVNEIVPRAELRRLGTAATPVAVIDEFTGEVAAGIELAAALRPFPLARGSLYPGLRRVITGADCEADAFVASCMGRAAPFVAGAFEVDRFDLIEASFSVVTTSPSSLAPPQRAPHFDSTDPDYIALLLYLGVPQPTGTAFFRHRATAIERVNNDNVDHFVTVARNEAVQIDAASGYIVGGNRWFDEIAAIDAVPDRMLIYPGCLLHSGIIRRDAKLDPDPRRGRLTLNFFIRLDRRPAS